MKPTNHVCHMYKVDVACVYKICDTLSHARLLLPLLLLLLWLNDRLCWLWGGPRCDDDKRRTTNNIKTNGAQRGEAQCASARARVGLSRAARLCRMCMQGMYSAREMKLVRVARSVATNKARQRRVTVATAAAAAAVHENHKHTHEPLYTQRRGQRTRARA